MDHLITDHGALSFIFGRTEDWKIQRAEDRKVEVIATVAQSLEDKQA
jgi:hypothetical protein